jgi:putative membrane protein
MRLLVGIPVLFVMILFALSNKQVVHLGIWPTDYAIDAPLSITILIAMAVAFVLGGFLVWLGAMGERRRARRAERTARTLEQEVGALRARLVPPDTRPSPYA